MAKSIVCVVGEYQNFLILVNTQENSLLFLYVSIIKIPFYVMLPCSLDSCGRDCSLVTLEPSKCVSGREGTDNLIISCSD